MSFNRRMGRLGLVHILCSLTLLALPACGGGGKKAHGDAGQGSDAGGRGDGGSVACLEGLQSIALSPGDSTVMLDGATPDSISFTATGSFADGSSRAIAADELAWEVSREDDTPPGEIDAGVLAPYGQAGGVVTVTATNSCASGSTTVTFILEATVGDPGDPADWSGTPDSSGTVPTIVYPSDQTVFPRNIYRTLFQWRTGGYSEFRLTFSGPGSTVTVYTDGAYDDCAGANPAAGCWEADEQSWSYIAGSNAGHQVTWVVDALDRSTTPPTVRRASSIAIAFSKRDVEGAIFYWSTTSAGVRRATVESAVPEDYVVGKPATTFDDGNKVKCVACHVVSRDGKYMAAPVDSDDAKGLFTMEVTADAPPTQLVKGVADTGGHGFATISPDDAYVAAAWGGNMWVVELMTGDYVEAVPLDGLVATQPDWSPLNTSVVFATAKGDGGKDAAIAEIPFAGIGEWGTPQTIVPAQDGNTNLFPMYSPQGDWIAYARGTSGGHDDLTAQLMVVPAGGGTPTELLQANRVVSNQTTDGQHQNSQPTWAPPGDYNWIAFNSMREYGVVLQGGTQQIWVAAIDLDKAQDGEDPSYPAFRLQFQGLDENNHRAYWTQDIRDTPPPPPGDAGPEPDAGSCVASGETCDPVTDTCCDSGFLCDTNDGTNYICLAPAVP